jgi:hypothetical protein
MEKPHATADECLLLIRLKRDHAKAALQKIIVEFAGPLHHVPSVVTLLDYLTSMVYCIELMLKLLSGNWRSHHIATMYKEVFGEPHPDPTLIADITTAIIDQKYLFHPSGGLAAKVEDLEALYQALISRVRERHPMFNVQVDIPAPPNLLPFLRDNLALYYVLEGSKSVGPLSAINLPDMYAAIAPQYSENIRKMQEFIDELTKNGGQLTFHQGEMWNI